MHWESSNNSVQDADILLLDVFNVAMIYKLKNDELWRCQEPIFGCVRNKEDLKKAIQYKFAKTVCEYNNNVFRLDHNNIIFFGPFKLSYLNNNGQTWSNHHMNGEYFSEFFEYRNKYQAFESIKIKFLNCLSKELEIR